MSEIATRRAKVLVIDDDEQHLKLAARMLRDGGYEVMTRTDSIGTSAAVASLRPDMVLIDLNMPGLEGDRLALLIKQSVSQPPLLVLYSGMKAATLRERARACNASGAIPKGLPPKEFIKRVARIFAGSQATPAPGSAPER